MKFKHRIDRKSLVRLGSLIILVALLPFSLELVWLIDIGGVEFALTFLIFYMTTIYNTLRARIDDLNREITVFVYFISDLYMFRPKVFIPHAAASGIIVGISCSVFLACLLWVPLMLVSSGFVS